MQTLLIQPPVTRATEPPIGLARLQAALRRRGWPVAVFDANIEAQRWLITPERLQAAVHTAGPATSQRGQDSDRRALTRVQAALLALGDPQTYRDHGRYTGAAGDLAAAFRLASRPHAPARVTPTDFAAGANRELTPADIHAAALRPERNPFAGYLGDDLLPRALQCAPRLVGISVSYAGQLHAGLALAGLLRRALPHAHLVIGGSLVGSWLQALPIAPELGPLIEAVATHFDTLVCGEGELPLVALREALAALPADQRRLPEPPPGCLQRGTDGRLQQGAPSALPRLDEVAHADFEGFPLPLYLTPHPVLPVGGSRGCYWGRCAFCPETAANSPAFQPRSALALVDEMVAHHERHGVRWFHLVDDAVPPRVLTGVADALTRRGLGGRLSWSGFARAERALADPAVCARLAAGGLRLLELGIESGSQRLLDLYRKGVPVAQASAVLRALHGAGVGTFAYVLFGIPTETEDDARRTLELVSSHADCIDFLHTSILRLTRDTLLESDARRFGIALADTDPHGHDGRSSGRPLHRRFVAESGMSAAEVRHFVDRVFRADPNVRAIERRTPTVFGAGHAPFRGPPR